MPLPRPTCRQNAACLSGFPRSTHWLTAPQMVWRRSCGWPRSKPRPLVGHQGRGPHRMTLCLPGRIGEAERTYAQSAAPTVLVILDFDGCIYSVPADAGAGGGLLRGDQNNVEVVDLNGAGVRSDDGLSRCCQ